MGRVDFAQSCNPSSSWRCRERWWAFLENQLFSMTMIPEDCLGDVTERIGADTTTNWERGETASAHVPKLLRFLSPNRDISPTPGQAFSELSKGVRPVASRAACRLGVDPTHAGRWERGLRQPKAKWLHLVECALAM